MSVGLLPKQKASQSSIEFVADLVLRRSAIVIDSSKSYLIESRLNPVSTNNGLDGIDALVDALRRPGSRKLADEVIDAMTTNESSFFRDLHPFNALRETIVPTLIENRSRNRTLNVWSAACSSGQEVYSIAMLLREHFPELEGWRIRLTATDLSSKILEKARSGIFSQAEINRGLPMPMVLKHFTREGLHWRIGDPIRRMVDFRPLNLVEQWPATLPKMDIVFLRNVLIYFGVDTKQEILTKVRGQLANDGCLFLGAAETTISLDVPFTREQIGRATCYRPN
jgi:chemotaxis protein methyltransferase CheR